MSHLEHLVTDSSDGHQRMKDHQASMSEQLEALKEELTSETRARETDTRELRKLAGAEELARAEQHRSFQGLILGERAAREKTAQGLAEGYEAQHGEVLNHLALERRSLEMNRASVEQRMSHMEQLFNTSAGRQSALKDHHVSISDNFEACKDELTKETRNREAGMNELRELLGAEKLARAEQHRSVQELILREQAASQKVTQDILEGYEAQHGEVINHLALEKGALSTLRDTVEDRVSFLEQLVNDSVDHQNAMKDHQASISYQLDSLREELARGIAQLHESDIDGITELVGCKKPARADHHISRQDFIIDLREFVTQLTLERRALATRHASVEERLSYLEHILNGSVDCQASMKDHQACITEQIELLREQMVKETDYREELCMWVQKLVRDDHGSLLELSMADASPWLSTALPTPQSPCCSTSSAGSRQSTFRQPPSTPRAR